MSDLQAAFLQCLNVLRALTGLFEGVGQIYVGGALKRLGRVVAEPGCLDIHTAMHESVVRKGVGS